MSKSGQFVLHTWLPDAMAGPTPVSALIHAATMVVAGIYMVARLYPVFWHGLSIGGSSINLLVLIGSVTALFGALLAFVQKDIKKVLAYSTISQLGYVVMAAAVLTPLSIAGAALHIAAHAFGKITLFFAAGSILTAAHKSNVSQLAGIGRRMPWTMAAFAVGALSMIGIPPTAGFVSKWYMLLGAADARAWFAVAVIVASSVLNAAYFLPIVYDAVLRNPAPLGPGQEPHGEAPPAIVAALLVTAAATVLLFFFSDLVVALARAVVPEAS
jgi:multicomponent Na+:H+ antiporter subunit D